VNRHGIVHRNLEDMHPSLLEIAQSTNRDNVSGSVHDALTGADVFIGVSSANLIEGADVARMNKGAIVFALANPNPEIDPVEAQAHAAVVATGRSDFPNQINNVLAFPGVFRGLLDVGATSITDEMLLAAAEAIADEVSPEQLNASFIVPSVFDDRVAPAVAQAIARLARRESEAKQ
jgi:malate dehydrogenase (oxaloacetate-decarboxylating)